MKCSKDGLTGSAWGDWANYTESPLRAFESELGVQAPLGYFDPMGLSKDGDVETFRRRRECELKNGRVAMFATIGYMVPATGHVDREKKQWLRAVWEWGVGCEWLLFGGKELLFDSSSSQNGRPKALPALI